MRARLSPYLFLTVSALFWGANFVVGRALSPDIPPVAMNFWRFFGALVVLLPFAYGVVWRNRRNLMANWRLLLALGVTGVSAFHSFVYTALNSTTAINAALFMALTPLAIPLFAFAFNKDMPTNRQVAGIVASFAGVVVLITRGDFASLSALDFHAGDLWMVAAFPCWSLYAVLLKRSPSDLPPMALLVGVIGTGVGLLLPAYFWEFTKTGGFSPSKESLLGLAFLAIFASALAYMFWNRGVGEIGATRAGPFMHLVPVFATIFALVFLGERILPYHGIGAALVISGIIVTADWRDRKACKSVVTERRRPS